MPTSKPANRTSRTLLLAGDSKNTVLAEMAGSIHHLAYSPYGQQSSRQEVMTHLGFNGELREAKTDWYFLGKGYRVYNPLLMRFHSYDKFSPFGKGGLNGYVYCGSEPVMRADPNGEGWFFDLFVFFNKLFSGSGSGGGSIRIANTAVELVSTNRTTFSSQSRSVPLGRSRNQPSAFPIQQSNNDSTNKSVNWASDTKPPAPPTNTTTPSAAHNGNESRRQSSISVSSNSSSASTPSTVSTVSAFSFHSHDSGYASSTNGSIRSNASADDRLRARHFNLSQN
jgi:RHS repeat-associated protein